MNQLDYIIIGILLFSIVIGLVRGFIKEILKLITLIGAYFVTFNYSDYLAIIFNMSKLEFIPNIIFHSLIFISIFIIGNFVVYLIYKTIYITGIVKIIDKLLAIGYGFVRCVIICIIVVNVLEKNLDLTIYPIWQQSSFIMHIHTLSVLLEKSLPERWITEINKFMQLSFLDSIGNNQNTIDKEQN